MEAKSRRRPGTLNEPGKPPVDWKTDVRNLYKKALQKDSGGHPLVILVDVNRPFEPGMPPGQKAWQKDVFEMFERLPENAPHNPACEALLVLTNFAWHHDRDGIAGPGEYMFALPSWSRRGIADRRVVEQLVAFFEPAMME